MISPIIVYRLDVAKASLVPNSQYPVSHIFGVQSLLKIWSNHHEITWTNITNMGIMAFQHWKHVEPPELEPKKELGDPPGSDDGLCSNAARLQHIATCQQMNVYHIQKSSEILPKQLTSYRWRALGCHQLFLWAVYETAAGVERDLGLRNDGIWHICQ